jgi:hypothetical protein
MLQERLKAKRALQGPEGMRKRHKGVPRFAALFALLLYTFLPSLHTILHQASVVPAAAPGVADAAPGAPGAPGAPAPQDKPVPPAHEQGCALGQGLAGHGPALAPLAVATLLVAPPAASLVLPPQITPRGVAARRPSSRGPPALEA